jgi:DNA-binding transcriptional ArsR family regulator
MDLFRAILLEVEQTPVEDPWASEPMLDHSHPEVIEHIRLLQDAGLVDARFAGNHHAMILRMTNSGHDFLESTRVPTLYEQTKERAKKAAVPLTIATIKMIFDALIKEHLHL